MMNIKLFNIQRSNVKHQTDMKASGEDRGNPHQHDFEILECKVNLRL